MTLAWQDIRLEEGDIHQTPCDCCGTTTSRIEGELFAPAGWLAFYALRFAAGHRDHGVLFQIGTGDWSSGDPAARQLFRAVYDPAAEGFRITDMPQDTGANATALSRADILGTPFAPRAFAMLDAIFMHDSRLQGMLR
ncbi:hypothetical protein [Ruixingdingia sedimenti]|uniref:Uncharacterized protein n=1 Tax=Ruixingdingia sedimenti TaxID=3073604 RepID=A0ABU1F611_9RHOB|nr:hypothetical protein [Xinfangfangia sp. LG-4]MDR5652302.1 hypothetical protein [Xinfangfangia sp. LG-4]